MTPQIRQWIYTVSAVASALIPLLVIYKVLDPAAATAWVNVVGVLGALGSGGAATAAVMTARQRKDGTLDFTGTPAQQAIDAIQATIAQASTAADDLARVKTAVSEVLAVADPVVEAVQLATGGLAEQLVETVTGAGR